ncbi:hypothetical protein [Delftia acidovorans]|uniref:Uncharacterized protein n=1 Tax=Delftia acidovorans TaxID=80866 RepID=A0AAJ2R8W8_DELAC|nr:hypothetical protein [Delftia acidovorans]MDX4957894.1 hypothetical protein [Delftia acidovorans]
MSKTETQSDALRLASKLRGEAERSIVKYSTAHQSAKELERLDAENKALRARLEAQAFVPPGFALVPMEPTKEMVAAACRDHGYPGGSRSAYVLGYRSMLAAAPQAAAKTGDAA